MRKILAVIFISILLTGYIPSVTSACSCAELPSIGEELERSQAVFSGKVVDVRENQSLKGNRTKSVLFDVTNTWKGVKQSQIIITTGLGGGDCGFDFEVGQDYLVYAHESTMYGAESLVTIICDRTNKLSALQGDLEILGEGQPPIEEVDLAGKQDGSQFYMWVALALAIGVVFIFILKRRKRSKK